MRNELRDQLKLHEGRKVDGEGRHKLYTDTVGVPTIGYGRNVEANGVSESEASEMLENDITSAIAMAVKHYPALAALDPIRRRVLIDMAFNLGDKLSQFPGMLAAMAEENWALAADHMRYNDLDNHILSLWYVQVKQRGIRLVDMMRSGKDYPK